MSEDNHRDAEERKAPEKEKSLHAGHRNRVREKFLGSGGLNAFADHEIIELLLFYCIPMGDVNKLAHKMLIEFGEIYTLFDAPPEEISRRTGLSINNAVLFSVLPHIFSRYEKSKWSERPLMDTSKKAGAYISTLFTGAENESMYLMCLDTRQRLLNSVLISTGTIDEATIYPRNIVRAALKYNAASVIIAHNHPSGNLIPSKGDISATTTIVNALTSIDVKVVDHIIVAGRNYYSFSEKKIMGLSY